MLTDHRRLPPGTYLAHIQEGLDNNDPAECWIWPFMTDGKYGMITVQRKKWKVHRYVAHHINGPCPEGMDASHLCGVVLCWNPDHIVYEPRKANNDRKRDHGTEQRGERHSHPKLTESKVLEIRAAYENGSTQAQLSRDYGVHIVTINDVVHRRSWTHI